MKKSAVFVIAAVFVLFCSAANANECDSIKAAQDAVESGTIEEFMKKYKEVINSVTEITPDMRESINQMIDATIGMMNFLTDQQKQDMKVQVEEQLEAVARDAGCSGCGATSYLTTLFVGCIILALQHLW